MRNSFAGATPDKSLCAICKQFDEIHVFYRKGFGWQASAPQPCGDYCSPSASKQNDLKEPTHGVHGFQEFL